MFIPIRHEVQVLVDIESAFRGKEEITLSHIKAAIVSVILLGVLLGVPSWATPVPNWLSASEISNAVSLPDGNHVYLRLEEILKIKADIGYIVVAEPFSGKDRLICLTNPSPELRLGQVVDVEGDLTTLPSGLRALRNVTVWGYASESGELTYHPSIIKCMPEIASWPWNKVDLTDRSTPIANTASTASNSSDEPNTTPAEGPRFYPEIGNATDSVAPQTQSVGPRTQSVQVQSFYPGIPNLQSLDPGSPVELHCKRIIAVGTETINSTLYKYLDMAEDQPSTDWIRCYYDTGTPTTSNRINKITGQIQYTTTRVICVDDGPDYDPQILVGEMSLVSPNTVAYVRTQPNGASATLTGKVITATQADFPGALYVQEPASSGYFGGIRLLYGGTRSRGDVINVTDGTVSTASDGERVVSVTSATFGDPVAVPGPLGMPNKHLGGGDFNVNTPGVNYPTGSGVGLYNKAQLVKAWGKVTAVDTTNKFFYIDDGTGFQDGSGNTGVKVSWAWSSAGKPAIIPPAVDWYVSVTGISSSETVTINQQQVLIRVLRPRDQDDITIHKGGDPYTGNPAPGWAEDVVPTDSSSAGEYGPSSADSVDLATGAGENNPEPDIVVENPSGPRVEFSRRYRSTLAELGYSSPGLSLGWVHNYDTRIHGTTGSWADLTLTYPNGATELLRPELSGGNPTGNFVALGAPYIVTGQSGGTTGQWDWIRITFPDETSWKFTAPNSSDPDSYLLLQVADQLAHGILINRVSTTDPRLLSITDDSSNTLMSFSYSGGYISTVSDVSVAGSSRDVTFAFESEAGATVLKSVSQPNSAVSLRWRYGYTAISGHPYLTWVEAPDCTGATSMRGHAVNYNADGQVSSLVDSNGNQRAYIYNGDSTQVFVKDQTGRTVEAWTQKIGPKNQDMGVVDADNHATSKEHQADYRLWRITNKNNQQTQFTYDGYGNVRTATDPRGLVTTYNYDDTSHPFRLTSVQVGTKTSTTYEYDARGLLWKINTPFPGRPGTGERVATTYTYTAVGNVETIADPSHGSSTATTLFEYTSDSDYGVSGVTEKLGQPLRVTVYEGDPANNQVISRAHFRYDSRGRVEEVIDGTVVADPNFRHRTNYIYNDNDQVAEIWYAPTGSDYTKRAHLIYTYSYPGGPLHSLDLYGENDSLFRHVDAANGNEGELLAKSGSVLSLSSAYDAMYRVKQITDGRSYVTRFNHNAVGNPTSIGYPSGPGTTWDFDADHNLNKRTDGLNRVTNYTLDAVDSKVTDVSYPSGSPGHYDYDIYGRVTGMTDSTGSVTYTYDDNDLILTSTTTYTGMTAKTVTYTYYPDGSRETVRVSGLSGTPTSATVRNYYSYDATYQGRLVSTVVPWVGGGTATIKCYYDWNGQVVRQGTPYVNTNYAYNARGFRTQLLNQPIWTQGPESLFTDMQYDAAGNLTQYDYDMHIDYDYSQWQYGWSGTSLTGTLSYTYDDLNRLTREVRTSSDPAYSYDVGFTPDAADNMESIRGLSLSYDSNNQVSGYTYDDNGNLTGCRGYTFDYDCRDLPTSVTGGMSSITMQFRADGLRTQKTVGSTVRYYIYDGDKVLCELNNLGQLVRAYGYGPNGLVQSALYPATSVPFNIYTFDPLGSPVHTLYVAGVNPYVSRITGYDAFGKRCWDDRVTFPGSGGSASDPMGIGFLAQYGAFTDYETRPTDTETPLVLMGVRYYDPITGRFISRDPAADSMNDYAYCANNPVMGFDPSGMGDARWCTYWNDVGKVFKGEFNAINPVNMYHGVKGLVSVCRKKGLKAGGSAMLHGTIRSYTGLFQLDDMERCGESTMVWTLTLSPAIKKIPSPFKGRAGASVVTATEAGATIAGKITGYTKHGINQAISRNGTGVSPKAILDAVKNPVKVIEQSGGRTKYVGSSAEVVLNAKGKVITVIAKTRAAHRIR